MVPQQYLFEVNNMATGTKEATPMDYEKITIYPMWYDAKVRKKLDKALRSLGVTFSYERY